MGSQDPQLVAVRIADPPERWEALGFGVVDGIMGLGGVRVMLGSDIMAWSVSGIPEDTTAIDGLPTTPARAVAARGGAPHPNGAVGIDHVVITTPDFDRTASALEQHAMPLRRIRDAGGFRQGFRRLGPAILELVEVLDGPPGPARLWGLVVIVEDLEALAVRLGDRLGPVRPAVQPGRFIATLRSSAGLSEAVAFMSPAG